MPAQNALAYGAVASYGLAGSGNLNGHAFVTTTDSIGEQVGLCFGCPNPATTKAEVRANAQKICETGGALVHTGASVAPCSMINRDHPTPAQVGKVFVNQCVSARYRLIVSGSWEIIYGIVDFDEADEANKAAKRMEAITARDGMCDANCDPPFDAGESFNTACDLTCRASAGMQANADHTDCESICTGGKVFSSGSCECPAGYTDNGGTCEEDAVDCTGNGDKTLRDATNNTCVCPAGMEDDDSTATPTNDCRCPANMFDEGGTCVDLVDCSTGNGDKTLRDDSTNTCGCPVGMEDNPDTADLNDCRMGDCPANQYRPGGTGACLACNDPSRRSEQRDFADSVPNADQDGCIVCESLEVPNPEGAGGMPANSMCVSCGVGEVIRATNTPRVCETCTGNSAPHSTNILQGCVLCVFPEVPIKQGGVNIRCGECADNEQIKEDPSSNVNFCERCTGGTIPVQSGNTRICTECNTIGGGELMAHMDNNACVCPAGMVEDNDNRGRCIDPPPLTCTGNAVPADPDGDGTFTCEACTGNMASNDMNTACIECTRDEVPNPEGDNGMPPANSMCVACEGKMVSNGRNTACITCDGNTRANDRNTACINCGPFQKPNEAGTMCIPDCSGNEAPNDLNDACEACTGGEVPDTNNTACIACEGNMVSNGDNTACIACQGNTIPDNNNEMCMSCGNQLKSNDGLSCRDRVAADCSSMVFVDSDKTCRPAEKNDCPEVGEVPNVAAGVVSCMECPDGMPENPLGLACRPLQAADCGAMIFVSGSPSSCRDAVAEDCSRVGQIPNVAAGVLSCTACAGATPVEEDGGLSCRARVAADCSANQFLDDNGNCRAARASDCPDNAEIPTVAAGELTCRACSVELTDGVANNAGTDCICPSDMREFENTGGIDFCAAPLRVETYSATDCTNADWTLQTVVMANASAVRINCEIPVRIDLDYTPPAANSAGLLALSAANLRPQVVADNTPYDACILVQHSGFSEDDNIPGGGNIPECQDPELFGETGLPVRPAGFTATGADIDRLIIVAAENNNEPGAPRRIFAEINSEIQPDLIRRFSSGGGGSGRDYGEIAMGVGAAAFVGLIVYGSWTGNPNAFSFSPETSFSHQNGWTNYSYGSRLEFRENHLSAYWGATQRNNNGETDSWEYRTGVKYTKDFWSAGFDSINYGETAAWDVSFAAQWRSGTWRWQSGINADYRLDESGEDAAAYWNTNLLLLHNRWAISPSVGLYWRDGDSFGEDARIRINLRREF